jgi:VWFA-related protein
MSRTDGRIAMWGRRLRELASKLWLNTGGSEYREHIKGTAFARPMLVAQFFLRLTFVAALLAGSGPTIGAQAPGRFRSGIDLVALEVCVRDRDGQFLEGLGPDDFLVLEDGAPQQVSLFVPEGGVPLAVMLAVDRSGSMAGARLDRAKAAAAALLRMLGPQDLAGVIAFDGRADRPVPLSTDHHMAEAAIERLTAGGATALFEAVAVAIADLRRLESADPIAYRKAVVVLSDGEDTPGSRIPFEHVLEDARRSGVLIYGVSLRTDEKGRPLAPTWGLTRLAHESGSRALIVDDLAHLPSVYEEIVAELRHLYRIGYIPANSARDGRWRTISVRVAAPGAVLRTRKGYYAPPKLPAFLGHRP